MCNDNDSDAELSVAGLAVLEATLDDAASDLETRLFGTYNAPLVYVRNNFSYVPRSITKMVAHIALQSLFGRRGDCPKAVTINAQTTDSMIEQLASRRIAIQELSMQPSVSVLPFGRIVTDAPDTNDWRTLPDWASFGAS